MLPDGYSIFTDETDPTTNAANNVKEGDLWNHTSTPICGYIRRNGKWVDAYSFWLRSGAVATAASFCCVSYGGIAVNSGYAPTSSFGVCPRFSI